jgi:hypothetical protein
VTDRRGFRVAPNETCPAPRDAEPKLRTESSFDQIIGGPYPRVDVGAQTQCCYGAQTATSQEDRCYSFDASSSTETCVAASDATQRVNASGVLRIVDGPRQQEVAPYSVCEYDVTYKSDADVCG